MSKRKRSGKRIALGIVGLILFMIPMLLYFIPYLIPQLFLGGYALYLIAFPLYDIALFAMLAAGIILMAV